MDPVAASYDSVAQKYAEEIGDELDRKPIDRAWLDLRGLAAARGGHTA